MACGGRAPAVLGKALAKTLLNDLVRSPVDFYSLRAYRHPPCAAADTMVCARLLPQIAPEIHSRVLQIPVQREKRFLQERDR